MLDTASLTRWLTAEEAAARLGVSRQTLYAYVSRRQIGVAAAPDDPRRSLYDGADVRRLADRNRIGRQPPSRCRIDNTFGRADPRLRDHPYRGRSSRVSWPRRDRALRMPLRCQVCQ
jgi:Helix-turn-helix domain